MGEPAEVGEAEKNRPYRRLVGVIFAIAVAGICWSILRGVIRALDRLPSAATLERPEVVDDRALRACAEDLERLQLKIQKAGSAAIGELPEGARAWTLAKDELELERLTLVARCRLDEATEDAAAQDLERAADELEALLRAYALLADRHADDGQKHAMSAREALGRAGAALKSR